MIFCNKSKATWKAAFKLLKKYPEKMKDIKHASDYRKKCAEAIKNLKTKEYLNFAAYRMAEANGFKGSPEFYWCQAETLTKIRILGLEEVCINFEECLAFYRRCVKNRNY